MASELWLMNYGDELWVMNYSDELQLVNYRQLITISEIMASELYELYYGW